MQKLIIHHFDQNAHAMLRFGKDIEILGIYDEREKYQGKDSGELIGMKRNGILISDDFGELLENIGVHGKIGGGAHIMLVTTGEGLYFTKPENVKEWNQHIKQAIEKGLDIYTMSKIFYGDKTADLKKIAEEKGVKFKEASDSKGYEKFIKYAQEEHAAPILKTPVVNFTGTSMNSGKITALLAIVEYVRRKYAPIGKSERAPISKKYAQSETITPISIGIVGTEPCSLFVGADEQVIPEVYPTIRGSQAIYGAIKKIEKEKNPDMIFVGGQTGLNSSVLDVEQARAGAIVAWQILFGSKPDKVVLCTKWNKTEELKSHINLIENSVGIKPCVIVINGKDCENVKDIIEKIEKETGIFCLDVLGTKDRLEKAVEIICKDI